MALLPSDYSPPEGWEALVVIAATVGTDSRAGDRDFWFASAAFAGSDEQPHITEPIGSVTQGSDVELVPAQNIEAVDWLPTGAGSGNPPSIGLFDQPSSVQMSATFGAGGPAADSRLTLIREVPGGTNQSVSVNLADATVVSGMEFLRLDALPAAFATVADQVSSGDSIILAITRPVVSIPAGHEAVLNMRITVGDAGSGSRDWYAAAPFTASGAITDASDAVLEAGQSITRARYTQGGSMQLNDSPSAISMADLLAEGGLLDGSTFHIVTRRGRASMDTVASLRESSPSGDNFAFWAPTEAWEGQATQVETGDTVVLAFTRQLAVVEAAGELTGGLGGSVEGAPQVLHHGAGALTGGLAGSVVGDGEIVEPSVAFTAPAGREVLVAMEVVVGDSEWYHPGGDPPQGSLAAGSDTLLTTPPDQHITRIRFSAGATSGTLTLNDNPSSVTFGQTFGAGGAAAAARFHLIDADGDEGTLDAAPNQQQLGNNFGRWTAPGTGADTIFFTVARLVSAGDRIIFAITVPEATGPVDVEGAGALAGGLGGSIVGAGAVINPDREGAGALAGGLAGSVAGAGEVVEPQPLAPSDFTAPEGHESLVVVALAVGTDAQPSGDLRYWLATAAFAGDQPAIWPTAAIGSVTQGSDVELDPQQEIEAVQWNDVTDRLTLHNRPWAISEPRFSDTFGEGGSAENSRVHIVRRASGSSVDQAAAFDVAALVSPAALILGTEWVAMEGVPAEFATIADQVVGGDSVILAITRPIVVEEGAGALTGGLGGSVAGAGAVINPDREGAGALAGGLAGSVEGAPQVLHHGAGALTGGLAGAVSAAGALRVDTAADLTGGLAGSVAATPAVLHHGAGALTGGLAGAVSATGAVSDIPPLTADATGEGELDGTATATGSLVLQPLRAAATGEGELDGTAEATARLVFPPVHAAASGEGELDGSATATGAVAGPITLADFSVPDGRVAAVIMAISVGSANEWYDADATDPVGSLLTDSDAAIQGTQAITRVRWQSGSQLLLNDTPSEVRLADTFGSGGVMENGQLHLVTIGGSASINATPHSGAGNNFIRWVLPAGNAFRNLANGVQAGQVVVLALTVPAALTAAATGEGELNGTAEATGSLVLHPLTAEATGEGELDGTATATGSLVIHPLRAEATGEGELDGTAEATGSLYIPPLTASATGEGELDGTATATGAISDLPILRAAATGEGELDGTATATGSLGAIPPLTAAATGEGELDGTATATGSLGAIPPLTAEATGEGELDGTATATGSLGAIPPLRAVASAEGELDGTATATGSLGAIPPLTASATGEGELDGTATATGRRFGGPALHAIAAAAGGLDGSATAESRLYDPGAGSEAFRIPDQRRLAVPSGRQAVRAENSTGDSVRLSWQAVPNAQGYAVRHRNASTDAWTEPDTLDADTLSTDVDIEGGTNGNTGEAEVRALGKTGWLAPPWGEFTVPDRIASQQTPALTPTSGLTAIRPVSTQKRVNFGWTLGQGVASLAIAFRQGTGAWVDDADAGLAADDDSYTKGLIGAGWQVRLTSTDSNGVATALTAAITDQEQLGRIALEAPPNFLGSAELGIWRADHTRQYFRLRNGSPEHEAAGAVRIKHGEAHLDFDYGANFTVAPTAAGNHSIYAQPGITLTVCDMPGEDWQGFDAYEVVVPDRPAPVIRDLTMQRDPTPVLPEGSTPGPTHWGSNADITLSFEQTTDSPDIAAPLVERKRVGGSAWSQATLSGNWQFDPQTRRHSARFAASQVDSGALTEIRWEFRVKLPGFVVTPEHFGEQYSVADSNTLTRTAPNHDAPIVSTTEQTPKPLLNSGNTKRSLSVIYITRPQGSTLNRNDLVTLLNRDGDARANPEGHEWFVGSHWLDGLTWNAADVPNDVDQIEIQVGYAQIRENEVYSFTDEISTRVTYLSAEAPRSRRFVRASGEVQTYGNLRESAAYSATGEGFPRWSQLVAYSISVEADDDQSAVAFDTNGTLENSQLGDLLHVPGAVNRARLGYLHDGDPRLRRTRVRARFRRGQTGETEHWQEWSDWVRVRDGFADEPSEVLRAPWEWPRVGNRAGAASRGAVVGDDRNFSYSHTVESGRFASLTLTKASGKTGFLTWAAYKPDGGRVARGASYDASVSLTWDTPEDRPQVVWVGYVALPEPS